MVLLVVIVIILVREVVVHLVREVDTVHYPQYSPAEKNLDKRPDVELYRFHHQCSTCIQILVRSALLRQVDMTLFIVFVLAGKRGLGIYQ